MNTSTQQQVRDHNNVSSDMPGEERAVDSISSALEAVMMEAARDQRIRDSGQRFIAETLHRALEFMGNEQVNRITRALVDRYKPGNCYWLPRM